MVEYLEYKGKKLPYRISYYAIKHLQKESKVEVDLNNLAAADIEILETIAYYALKSGHNFVDTEFKIDREEMEFILDVCLNEFMKGLSTFTEGLNVQNPLVNQPVMPTKQPAPKRKKKE